MPVVESPPNELLQFVNAAEPTAEALAPDSDVFKQLETVLCVKETGIIERLDTALSEFVKAAKAFDDQSQVENVNDYEDAFKKAREAATKLEAFKDKLVSFLRLCSSQKTLKFSTSQADVATQPINQNSRLHQISWENPDGYRVEPGEVRWPNNQPTPEFLSKEAVADIMDKTLKPLLSSLAKQLSKFKKDPRETIKIAHGDFEVLRTAYEIRHGCREFN